MIESANGDTDAIQKYIKEFGIAKSSPSGQGKHPVVFPVSLASENIDILHVAE